MVDPARLEAAIAAFDRLNAEDPSRVRVDGRDVPRELANARRLSEWVRELEPEPSEALLLAARCQHLMRWKVPRAKFPSGRVGYHQWRRRAAEYHAAEAGRVLASVGYDATTIEAVQRINLKQGLGKNDDVQTMEDALCLSFMEHELDEFSASQDDEKMIGILRTTWRKMSPRGRERAHLLVPELSARARELVAAALGQEA